MRDSSAPLGEPEWHHASGAERRRISARRGGALLLLPTVSPPPTRTWACRCLAIPEPPSPDRPPIRRLPRPSHAAPLALLPRAQHASVFVFLFLPFVGAHPHPWRSSPTSCGRRRLASMSSLRSSPRT